MARHLLTLLALIFSLGSTAAIEETSADENYENLEDDGRWGYHSHSMYHPMVHPMYHPMVHPMYHPMVHPMYHPMVHPMYHPMYHYLNQESSEVEQGEEKVDRRDLLARRARAADADADDLASGKGSKGYGGYKFKGYKKVGKSYKKAFKGWHLNQESSDVKKEEAVEGEEKVDRRDLLAKRAMAAEEDADDLASGKGSKGYGGYKFKGYKKVAKSYKKAWHLNQESSHEADADDLASGKGYGGYKGYKKVGKAYNKAWKAWR